MRLTFAAMSRILIRAVTSVVICEIMACSIILTRWVEAVIYDWKHSKTVYHYFTYHRYIFRGGCVTECLRHRTWNTEVGGSSPALTTQLELFLGRPQFNSSVMLVNGQLPPTSWDFMLNWYICFFHFKWHACELVRRSYVYWLLSTATN